MKLWDALMALLFPPKCVLCGKVLKRGQRCLCSFCLGNAPWYPNRKEKLQFLDSFAAVWYYEGSVRKSLLRYKFYHARSYASSYASLLAQVLQQTSLEAFDVITWVPVSPLRRLRRGYDQVELLAKALGKELAMEPVPLLTKVRHNRPQSGIARREQRRANVLGAYREKNPEAIAGKRILLLDDILTTGSTAGECARILLTAGAEEVHCAAIAAARK